MARPNEYGKRFFTRRGDRSNFAYVRDVPPDLKGSLSGEVILQWSGERRTIGGRSVLTISFETSDETLAASRWLDIHAQIERLVESARLRSRRRRDLSNRCVEVEALNLDQIRVLGTQYYHDMLADEDAIEASMEARIERIGFDLHRKDIFGNPDWGQLRQAEIDYHERERAGIEDSLMTGEFDGFDASLHMDKSGNWHSDPERPAADDIYYTEDSKVEDHLILNGINLPLGHPSRQKLVLELARQKVRAHLDIIRRKQGDHTVLAPTRPELDLGGLIPRAPGLKLADMFALWKSERRPAARTAMEFRLYLDRFVSLHGDLDLKQITRAHIQQFRDAMLEFPRKIPAKMRHDGVRDLILWANSQNDVPRLGATTVNDRAIGALSAILATAVREKEIDENPCHGTRVKLQVGEGDGRPPYTDADLKVIFSSPVFKEGQRPKGGAGEAAFWLPYLALFTGARLEELAQLRVKDVCVDERDGERIDYLDLMTMEASAATKLRRKTSSSRRKVPLHSVLIERGFLDYAASLKSQGKLSLFPELNSNGDKRSVSWSKWWGRYARVHFQKAKGLHENYENDPKTVFHSFRHSFIDACRDFKVDYVIMKKLIGHSFKEVTDNYGRGYSLSRLKEAVDCIAFKLE